jgi:hypothetical protein
MQIELTYQVPFGRLTKLSRTTCRKVYPSVWLMQWVIFAVVGAGTIAYLQYYDALDLWMRSAGMPLAVRLALPWIPFSGLVACYVLLRKLNIYRVRSRIDFDLTIHLTKDDGGLRLATEGIEYYLKWLGISQMLMEPDGVVVLCANVAFLVPDAAFPDAGTRLAFIREVYGHLTEKARSASEKYIRPVLGQNP